RNDVDLEMRAFDAGVEDLDQAPDVVLQPDALADLVEVLPADLPVFGVVQQQVGQLSALLHEVDPCQAGDLLLEARGAQQLAEHDPRVVEAQRLVEVAGEQVLASVVGLFHRPSLPSISNTTGMTMELQPAHAAACSSNSETSKACAVGLRSLRGSGSCVPSCA